MYDFTKLVVPYEEPKLYLLAIRNNITLEEFSREYLGIIAKQLFGDKISIPKSYICHNIKEIQNAANELTDKDENFEGFVLCDKNFNRIKIKSSLYTNLFFIRGEGVFSNKKILKLIMDEQDDDVIAYFPEYKEQFDKIRRGLSNLIQNMKNGIDEIKKWKELDKKDFAAKIKDFKYKDILFKAYGCQIWDKDEDFYSNFIKSYVDNLYEFYFATLLRYVKDEMNE